MRIGTNPQKDQHQPTMDHFHQVVIPVYIPDAGDYFKESKTIIPFVLGVLAMVNPWLTVMFLGGLVGSIMLLRSFLLKIKMI